MVYLDTTPVFDPRGIIDIDPYEAVVILKQVRLLDRNFCALRICPM